MTSFFDTTEVEVSLTYDFLSQEAPMKFFLRPQLAKEERQARQVFFALPMEDREAKQHEHNVNMLAMLSTREPENVPTFKLKGDLGSCIREFFSGENVMKKKVVEDALSLYFAKSQPVEFFR